MPSSPETSSAAVVEVERHDAIALLRLNRPERLNAVSLPLYEGLTAAVRELNRDRRVRAMVITGAGRAFCVGADLVAHGSAEPDRAQRKRYIAAGQRANRALQRSGMPIIAAVNGHAIGAGLELALSADYVVVAEEAKLRFPEVALGTFVGGGTTYTLPERVGFLRAKELLLLAEFVDAGAAVEMGLANEAVPAEQVLARSLDVATRLAARAPVSLRLAKRLLNASREQPAARMLRLEAQALLTCMSTADWKEGLRAFEEKRDPEFVGE